MSEKRKTWMGTTPEKCQLCGTPIINIFIDGKTRMGPWAIMCINCHNMKGHGLGTGAGQRYELDPVNKTWEKVAG